MPGREDVRKQVFIIVPAQAKSRTHHPYFRSRHHRTHPLTVLLSLLALLALAHMIAVAHTANITGSPADCSQLLRTTDYAKAVHLQPATQQMEAVQLVNDLAVRQPVALVQVTSSDAQNTLDIYVYGCTLQKNVPRLTTLLAQRGLVQGTATISNSNTLFISQLDTALPAQAATLLQPLQQYVYREYAWRDGSLVQVPFPGFYPVTSRSEAEQLQQQADSGAFQEWTDPLVTAQQMASDLLNWSAGDVTGSLLSNNGTAAQVLLVHRHPAIVVTVSLARLIQQNSAGIWFVLGAQSADMSLNQSLISGVVTSPITLQGTGALPAGQASATIFDHTLTRIDTLNNATLNVDASGIYTGSIFYAHLIPNQQGVLLIQSLASNSSVGPDRLLLTSIILG